MFSRKSEESLIIVMMYLDSWTDHVLPSLRGHSRHVTMGGTCMAPDAQESRWHLASVVPGEIVELVLVVKAAGSGVPKPSLIHPKIG